MSPFDLHPKLFLTNGTIKTTGTSANLTSGDLGLYDAFTHQVVTAGNAASHPVAYVAQGSYYVSDKIGPNHGGYKESVKSPAPTKGIDPRFVKRFYKVAPQAAQNQSVRLFWDGAAATGPNFLCGKTYYLRLEVKGEPVLRLMNRFLYSHLPAYTGCCANDCSAPCDPLVVDAATVMYSWAKAINAHPLLSKFVTARAIVKAVSTSIVTNSTTTVTMASTTGIVAGQRVIAAGVPYGTTVASVTNGTTIVLSAAATASATVPGTFNTVIDDTYVTPTTDQTAIKAIVAGLEIDSTYSETVFDNCSFSPGDYYNDNFVEILASLVYQNGDVCESGEVVMNSSTGVGFTEVVPFVTPGGSGELVLREFIADQHQQGIFFSSMPREREVSGNIAMTAVDRAATYTRYYIIYSILQTGNPSNALSNDQYILCFAWKTGLSASTFETLMTTWLQAHNPRLSLETIA